MTAWIALLMASLAAPPVELISHRGESADAPENTLAAFHLAWERKVPAIELDVHITADGVAAVIHDVDTKRTCGVKKLIRETNWADLKDLDAGSWKNPKFAGEKIPRLEQALATVPPEGKCFIEIKVGAEAVPVVAKAVESSGLKHEQIVIISFQAGAVAAAKMQIPHLKAYYLSGFKQDARTKRWAPTIEQLIQTAKEINADGLDLSYKGPVDAELVKKVRDAKLGLLFWTVNDADIARDLIKLGVDGITTDKAAWLREELKKSTAD